MTAVDAAGKEAVGRRAHEARPEPDAQTRRSSPRSSEPAEIVGARMRAHQEAMENNPWLEATIEQARAQANAAP